MSVTSEPRYRLDARIATGGMGEVWQATDTLLDREVAVKVLKPEYADDPTFRSRFEAEARHAASLDHPNVASVFDFGELAPEDGSGTPRPYLVMELVPGRPLSALLRDGQPMPPERAADLVAQAADAVASAHALGIVHRDVKPANLLVTPTGQVKITDFGIARAADGAGLTQTGQVVGTPAYISPEQAEGHPATQASDIYSLGVVLYECLAGRRPFTGDTPVSTALAHLRDEPPPLPDRVPAHLRQVVATALAKDPARRFPTMAAFASAVREPATGAAAAPPVDEPDATRVLTGVVPAPAAAPAGSDPRHGRGLPAWAPWAGAAVGVLAIVLLLAALTGGQEKQPAADAGTPSPAASPASAQASRTPGPRVVAADYIGLPFAEARTALRDLGLRVERTDVANSGDHQADTVADVSPTGRLARGDVVTLSVWGPVPKETKPPKDSGKPGHGKDEHKDKGKKKGHQ